MIGNFKSLAFPMRLMLAISMTALLLGGCEHRPENSALTPVDSRSKVFQVGLVLDSPAVDAIPMAFPRKDRGGHIASELLSVRIVPGLDETTLEREQRICAFGLKFAVEVQFKGEARQQWADFTRTNIGKDVALIVDGRVFRTTTIGAEASDGWLVIPGNWTLQEAQAFCKRLNATANSEENLEAQP